MPPSIIRARSGSPADVHRALEAQARSVRWGPIGPIGAQPMVYIPMASSGAAIEARANWQEEALRRRFETPPAAAAPPRFNIGGYATRTGTVWPRHGRVAAGAYRDMLARHELVHLYVNHDWKYGIFASTADGTLRFTEDAIGLWFEAQLPDTTAGRDLLARIGRGGIQHVSIGADKHRSVVRQLPHGQSVWSAITLNEISLLVPPARPAMAGTVVEPIDVARLRRHLRM